MRKQNRKRSSGGKEASAKASPCGPRGGAKASGSPRGGAKASGSPRAAPRSLRSARALAPSKAPGERSQRASGAARQVKTVARPRPPAAAKRPNTPLPPEPQVHAAQGVRQASSSSFPIVGIGASAGGLEALEEFFRHVPHRCGMAFVVIQHLDPRHEGAMVELLQRVSAMPVLQAKDRQRVEPDTVYVIPPSKDLSVMGGVLHLLPQTAPRGLNLPIDFFFRSLAADQQERATAVVLSGMGSDGTLGLRAIKEKAGTGFAQSLDSAKFDSMPRSAIEAGLIDVVAPAAELPARIIAFHQHAPHIARPQGELEQGQQSALEKVLVLLRAHTGNDFSLYKRSTVYRRIERRMGLHQIDKMAAYVRYLRESPREIDLLFKELLIGVTSFFRDLPAWDQLRDELLPKLLQARPNGGVLRAWVPGCSTGEEAYSLAIVLREAIDALKPGKNLSFQIFATDLDRDAIDKARQGVYPANIAADVSAERLHRFFLNEEHGFRVRKEVRETVVFAVQNLIMDPPFTKLDVLSCRNLLIYLSPELQKKLIPLFHYTLAPGGILFLGNAETVGTFTGCFAAADAKTRLYRRLETPSMGALAVEFPSALVTAPPPAADETPKEPLDDPRKRPALSTQAVLDRLVVQHYSPAAVLTNDQGDILYITGKTGKYLEPAVGKANLNVMAMAREGLRYELSSAFSSALRAAEPVSVKGIRVATNGSTQMVDLTVQKLSAPKELRGTMLIVITDRPSAPEPVTPVATRRVNIDIRLAELERELQQAREEVQTAREEMQTSQEELKSTNEELQSTNEELQSTNEELTTSKEEMQSMNEELQTVNHELQAKVEDLSRSNNDMKNLLNSTDVATLFLDGRLLVRRFTKQISTLIKLIPGDIGRPITDIATELEYPSLADDARDVLATLAFKEKQVPSRDGRWFLVRIMPYRTLENVIDGVVLTFTEITAAKTLENTLREQTDQLRQIAESLPCLVWSSRPDGACEFVNRRWLEYTGVSEAELLGFGWLEQIHPDERGPIRDAWKSAVGSDAPLKVECRVRSAQGAWRWFKTESVPIRDAGGNTVKWYGTSTDIDDLKQSTEARRRDAEALSIVLDELGEGLLLLDGRLVVTYLNASAARLLGRTRRPAANQTLAEVFPAAAASEIERQCEQALRARSALACEVHLPEDGSDRRAYRMRIHPHEQGVSIFFQDSGGPERASAA